jgi:phosphatidate cytidylyltransferase
MSDPFTPANLWLLAGVFGLLSVASIIGWRLSRRVGAGSSEGYRRTVLNLNARLRAWWVIVIVCAAALLLGRIAAAVLFGILSLLALREFMSLAPARTAGRATLYWVYSLILPIQYGLAASGFQSLFAIFIPVCALVFIPAQMALSGECSNLLQRAAVIQFALMICVYGASHAPAVMTLKVPTDPARLLAFFLLVVQLSDVFQYVWGKLFGRHPIAPLVSPSKTWEGFGGGVATATVIGTALWRITPFRPWQAALISLCMALLGFVGGLVMSGIKRDRNVKDFGTLIAGHGGVLDRLDSVCFSAPVFYYLTLFFFT